MDYIYHQKEMKKIEKVLKRAKSGKRIRVGFFVLADYVFQSKSIYKILLKDERFDPFIVVLADVFRTKPPYLQSKKTFEFMSELYENVYLSFNPETYEMLDFTDKCELAFFNCPYDLVLHDYYKSSYFKLKNIPICFLNYAYQGRTNYEKIIFKSTEYMNFWKIFLENEEVLKYAKEFSKTKEERFIVSGYAKMDSLSKIEVKKRDRKRVIIAPHHTIIPWKDGLNIGNFLNYADFFLNLPKKYPEIDWIWRPHQLLYENLIREDIWGRERTDRYFNEMSSMPNVEYQSIGDYFETFINSDGMIHDCGSFLAEYLYTKHPQCYTLKNDEWTKQEFLPFGQKMLDHVYRAYNEQQITEFIEEIVINGNDYMSEKRNEFADREIRINYPNATIYIYNYLIKTLKLKGKTK